MSEWVTAVTEWLSGILQSFLEIVANMLQFVIVVAIDLTSLALEAALNAIALPGSMTSNGLDALISGFPPGVGYMLNAVRLNDAVAIIASAVLVRLARKAITLFQW